ncbi:MAG TPA: RluA family pseudouridine synthase [Candidatus Acidoferrum sp.]|nr:RluA family pseudouridine synthase [Candidatus Acidoferrum sp.]
MRKEITIGQSLPLERLDAFLRTQFPGVSRGTIQRLLAGGHIRVNGRTAKPSHHPRAGEVVSVSWPEAVPPRARPEDIRLEILYEDEDLLAVNKPAGLVVHPAAGHAAHTLVNALLHHCAGELSGIGGVARPGIVHRLDKDTSGCLVVAKNDAVHLHLSGQFAARQVEKTYEAIICGRWPGAGGEIDAPISRHRVDRKRMAAGAGRPARTTFRVLEWLRGATRVEVDLHTGRTHQIRVHFQHLGFPLVGDLVYGRRHNARLREATGCPAPRQMLHARRLALTHPRSGRRLVFEAPLPEDFTIVLQQLRLPLSAKHRGSSI